jgi:hypothetical protein
MVNVVDRVEQLGSHAHERGIRRVENPYLRFTCAPSPTAESALTLADAWWRGWDRAEQRMPG